MHRQHADLRGIYRNRRKARRLDAAAAVVIGLSLAALLLAALTS